MNRLITCRRSLAIVLAVAREAVGQTAFYDAGAVPGLGYVFQLPCELNGDGLPDFLGCTCSSTSVSTRLSNGILNYVTGPIPPTLSNIFAVGDLNNDGFQDIAGDFLGLLVTLLGAGGGTFAGPILTPLVPVNAPPGPLVDLDGDGRLDLLVLLSPNASPAPPAIGKGTGSGTFTLWPLPATVGGLGAPLQAADVNGDGLLDLFTFGAGGVRFLIQSAGGWIPGPVIPTPGLGPPYAFELGDVNGDLAIDVVYALAAAGGVNGGIGVSFGPQGALSVPYPSAPATVLGAQTPSLLAVADLDLDGIDDVVTTQWLTASNLSIVVRYGSPAGLGLEVQPALPPGSNYPQILKPLDLDADGDLDFGFAPGNTAPGLSFRAILNLAQGSHPGASGVFAPGCPSQLYPPSPAFGVTGSVAPGQAFALTSSAVAAGAAGFLLISWRPAAYTLPNGCLLAIDVLGPAPFPIIIPHGFSGGLSSTFPATMPAWPGLSGLRFYLQDLVIASGYAGGYATSNGLMIVIG